MAEENGMDLTEFHGMFFEEAGELLANMENLLVNIDVQAPTNDDLNAIFRAAHSIKGGAGTFGFTDMNKFTHEMESLLDKIRKGEMQLTVPMVDTFLQSSDVIKAQIAFHKGDATTVDAPVDEILGRIKAFMFGGNEMSRREAAPTKDDGMSRCEATPTEAAPTKAAPSDSLAERHWQVSFKLAQGEKVELDNVYSELARLGTVIDKAGTAQGKHQVVLRTAVADSEIIALLDFVAEPGSVEIGALTDSVDHTLDQYYEALTQSVGANSFAQDNNPLPGPPPHKGEGRVDVRASSPAHAQAVGANSFAQTQDVGANSFAHAGNKAYGFFENAPGSENIHKPPAESKTDSAKTPAKAPAKAAPGNEAESSIRVAIDKVDQVINLVGELVITQAMLAQTAQHFNLGHHEKLLNALNQLERNTRDLQQAVMSIRMLPMAVVFSRFPRVVRDLASKLSKQVELKTEGETTELDKGLIEKITDPLTHLVRNSLDHGIETPDKRKAAGKAEKGTITLRAFHQGGNIVIEVEDDGAGLNRDRILSKAKERGLAVSETISDQEVWMLIFEAGFSTAEKVTDVSGRGVGMDVVRRNIEELGGRVEINSKLGAGSRMSIRLPLTLAILDGISIAVGSEVFIIPIASVVESLQPGQSGVKTVTGKGRVIEVRGEYLPVVSLAELFNIKAKAQNFDQGIMMILEADGVKAALWIDEMIGQHQVVIKSLETNYHKVPGTSGATIMGDGRVALILDVTGLIKMTRH